MYSSTVDGLFIRQFASGMYDNTEGWRVSGDVSKSFSWAKTVLKASVNWNNNNYHILLDKRRVPYNMQSLSASLGFSMKPIPLISIEEKSYFYRTVQSNKNADNTSDNVLNHFEHNIKIFVLPGKWQIEIDNEFYHSNDHSVSFSHFADMAVSYRTKKYEIGFWINNIVGTDKYERRYTTLTQNIYSVTKLRPRELMARILFNL